MNLFFWSMALTIAANVIYHFCQKAIAPGANPMASLIVTYAGAMLAAALAFPLFYPADSFAASFRTLNWASYVLSIGVVGLELGFLLAYRAGWNLSLGALVSNVAVTLLLIPIGVLLYRETISPRTALGIVLAIAGLVLISKKA